MKSFYVNPKYDSGYFTFIVNCLDYCNFACPYCCERCNDKSRPKHKIDFKALTYFIQSVVHKIEDTKLKTKISLYGGEPTLCSGILDFVDDVYRIDKDAYIEMYTNFSASIEEYRSLIDHDVKLILTYHSQSTDFITKLEQISDYDISDKVIVNVMYQHDNSSKCIEIYGKCKEIFNKKSISTAIPVVLKTVRPAFDYNKKYTDDQVSEFNSTVDNNEMNDHYIYEDESGVKHQLGDQDLESIDSSFKNWLCQAGRTSCYISPVGEVYACTSELEYEVKTGVKTSICSIFTPDKLSMKPHICRSLWCTDYDSRKDNVFKLK